MITIRKRRVKTADVRADEVRICIILLDTTPAEGGA